MNRLKKYLLMGVILTVGVISIVGCSSSKEENDKFKVGVVLGEGGANDQSFNQSSLAGLDKAKGELNIDGSYLESTQDADYTPNIDSFIDQGSDLIIGVGYTTAESMLDAAKLYPDKKFVMIDHNYEEDGIDIPENMLCAIFDEREAAYLVGIIAANMTETNKIGFLGGMKIPNITRFEEGFAKGIKDSNKNIELQSQYANSFDDASLGKSIATQMYTKGVDVIFSAAGGVGTGAIEVAKESDKYAIGVDMDQNSLAPNNVITSAMKRVDVGVFDIISKASSDNFEGGKAVVYGLKDEAVGIAPSSNKNVSKEVLDVVDEKVQLIIDKKISVK